MKLEEAKKLSEDELNKLSEEEVIQILEEYVDREYSSIFDDSDIQP